MGSSERSEDDILEEARSFVKATARRLGRVTSGDDSRRLLQGKLDDLRRAILDGDEERTGVLLDETRDFIEKNVEFNDKSAFREYAESIGLAILLALILRGFVIEAFKIPTGSMIPTLLVGDHIFVNKFIYGLRFPFTDEYLVRFSEPERGEVVVFTFPADEARKYLEAQPASRRDCIDRRSLDDAKDFIKRVVGVEGDVVELKNNVVLVNGQPLRRKFQREEVTGNFLHPHQIHELETSGDRAYTIQYNGSDPDFEPIKVREDHVFVMGDNRDNSSDGRCWGQVPVENIKGRATFIWWSIAPDSIRWDRVGQSIR